MEMKVRENHGAVPVNSPNSTAFKAQNPPPAAKVHFFERTRYAGFVVGLPTQL